MKPSKKLLREWNERLKRDGFNDIEKDSKDGDRQLKRYEQDYFRQRERMGVTPIVRRAKLEYYEWARGLLDTHKFSCERDKRIWDLHVTGYPVRAIATALAITRSSTQRSIKRTRRQARGINGARRSRRHKTL